MERTAERAYGTIVYAPNWKTVSALINDNMTSNYLPAYGG
jgi:hypothetical protein